MTHPVNQGLLWYLTDNYYSYAEAVVLCWFYLILARALQPTKDVGIQIMSIALRWCFCIEACCHDNGGWRN